MTRPPVIAVFGSGDPATVPVAFEVGRAVVAHGCTLLTGGGRASGEQVVKESALDGARSAGRGRRVGVLGRESGSDVFAVPADGDAEIVIALGYGDQRNYVNACLCDAAVAFQGGPGTKSEVAFCLAEGRPVVLVGPAWANEFPMVTDAGAFHAFLREVQRCVHDTGAGSAIDHLVGAALGRLDAEGPFVVDHLSLDHPPADIAELAARRAVEAGLPGAFPELPERRAVADAYRQWLTGADPDG